MASNFRQKYDSYPSGNSSRKKIAVSSSPAAAPSLRPSARKKAGSSRRNVEPTRKTTDASRRAAFQERNRGEKQRLSEIKRQERQRRQRERFLRRILGISLLLLVIGGLIVGGILLVNSSTFDVTSITVSGNTHVTADDVKSLAGVSSSSSLLLLDKDKVVSRLRVQPWIQDAKLEKRLPHTLAIRVIERTPKAVVVLPGAQNKWLVSNDNVWLGKLDVDEASTQAKTDMFGAVVFNAKPLIHIIDVPLSHPRDGKKASTPEVTNSIKILNGLSAELRSITARVSAPSVAKTKIFTQSGIEIAIGSSEDIKTKDRIARSILTSQKGKVVLINVRSIDAPTWRGLSEN